MMLPEWEQIYSLSASTACIPVQNFRWFARVPTSQWATTFALQGYLLLRSNAGPIVIQINSYKRGTRSMLRLCFIPCMIPTFV